jgi:diacylglycerol kinase
MDFSHPDYALQARPNVLQNILSGLRKVFASDPGLTLQIILAIPVIAGGIVLQLNAVQWVLVIFVTLLFLVAGIFRTAALLQIRNDSSITPFQASRIRLMGNSLVVIAAGLSLLTYLLVFIPRIIQML